LATGIAACGGTTKSTNGGIDGGTDDAGVVARSCGGQVEQVAPLNGYATWIGLAGSRLYFSLYADAVESVPSAGNGAPSLIANATGSAASSGEYVFNGFAFDSSYVYWSESVGLAPSTIKRAPLGGGASEVIASSSDGFIGGIAIDGGNVYWVDQDEGEIRSIPVNGGSATVIATGLTTPAGIAIHARTIYLTDANSDLMAVAIGGGAVTTLVHGPGLPSNEGVADFSPGLAVDDENVYFTQYYARDPVLAQVPLGGGAMTVLAHASAYGIAVDAHNVYWLADDSLFEAPIGGGPVCVLATNESEAVGPALDDSSVYWATSLPMGTCVGCPPPTGTNAIFKVPK